MKNTIINARYVNININKISIVEPSAIERLPKSGGYSKPKPGRVFKWMVLLFLVLLWSCVLWAYGVSKWIVLLFSVFE